MLNAGRSLTGFSQIVPKGFEAIEGSLMVSVTNKHDNKKSQVDPTEGIHKSHSPSVFESQKPYIITNRPEFREK